MAPTATPRPPRAISGLLVRDSGHRQDGRSGRFRRWRRCGRRARRVNADYRNVGTLTFAWTDRPIFGVAVFNDTIAASEEAATLYHEQRLWRIADNAATGTIVNDDPVPGLACAAWATQVVSQTLAAHPASGLHPR